jgi:hypothetical protein
MARDCYHDCIAFLDEQLGRLLVELQSQGPLLWLSHSGLLVVAWGDPEAFLWTTFGRQSRADAFEHLNGVPFPFWLVHSPLVLIAIAAGRFRRLWQIARAAPL